MNLDPAGVIAWAVVGLLAGFMAGLVFKGSGFGLLVDLVVGLAGAFAGGFILSLVGIAGPTGFIGSVVVAVMGAVILLWLSSRAHR